MTMTFLTKYISFFICAYPNSAMWTGFKIGLTIYLYSGPSISYYGRNYRVLW